MGWDGISMSEIDAAGGLDLFLEKQLETPIEADGMNTTSKILAKDKNSDGRFYVVEEETTKAGETEKKAVVVIALTENRGGYIAIKWMGEREGPYRYASPKFIKEVERYIPSAPGPEAVKWRTKSLNRDQDMGY